ncbi:unnamed protein product [Brachionus calyciflorus]|uniref:Hydrogen voltage-gated channel 1 n=1 Tax=Brachionus calyciflorus TaxID=104777 RepID=A0A813TVZ5_9BILA|nr:unnamed protein product [Brachionus calyciflorus]
MEDTTVNKIPKITYSKYNECSSATDTLLKSIGSNNSPENNDSHCNLELPKNHELYRHSIASHQSIEFFLSNFPRDETEFANREIMNAVHDIMHSSIGLNSKMTFKEKTRLIIQSHKFHLLLIALVVLDCICVVLQVVLDIVSKENHDPILYIIEEIVEILSVFILLLFLISILFHIIFVPKIFFKSKLEIFDSLIVLISFILEIVSIIKKDSVREIEAAVITFRFWRIIRIVNAIVITVEKRVFVKLENLKKDIKSLLDENKAMESELNMKVCEIHNINAKLDEKKHVIKDLLSQLENYKIENQNHKQNDFKNEYKLKVLVRENNELRNYLRENFKIQIA